MEYLTAKGLLEFCPGSSCMGLFQNVSPLGLALCKHHKGWHQLFKPNTLNLDYDGIEDRGADNVVWAGQGKSLEWAAFFSVASSLCHELHHKVHRKCQLSTSVWYEHITKLPGRVWQDLAPSCAYLSLHQVFPPYALTDFRCWKKESFQV